MRDLSGVGLALLAAGGVLDAPLVKPDYWPKHGPADLLSGREVGTGRREVVQRPSGDAQVRRSLVGGQVPIKHTIRIAACSD